MATNPTRCAEKPNPLGREARETIRSYGVTVAAYVQAQFPDGRWSGDRCGCPDDRCAGHHHEAGTECGCLRVLVEEVTWHEMGLRGGVS